MKEIFNKHQRFSIRKFSVGVASVVIGITLFQTSPQFFAATDNVLLPKVAVSSDKERVEATNDKQNISGKERSANLEMRAV